MALASVSPTVAGSKPKKLLDQTRDVITAGAQSEAKIKLPAQPARRGGRSLSEFRHDPASLSQEHGDSNVLRAEEKLTAFVELESATRGYDGLS